jgi:hypothetical protein
METNSLAMVAMHLKHFESTLVPAARKSWHDSLPGIIDTDAQVGSPIVIEREALSRPTWQD